MFVFKFSSHYHINVVKSLFTCRYDQFENLRETTVLACEMLTSGVRPWLKNVACLSALILGSVTLISRIRIFICLFLGVKPTNMVPGQQEWLLDLDGRSFCSC